MRRPLALSAVAVAGATVGLLTSSMRIRRRRHLWDLERRAARLVEATRNGTVVDCWSAAAEFATATSGELLGVYDRHGQRIA